MGKLLRQFYCHGLNALREVHCLDEIAGNSKESGLLFWKLYECIGISVSFVIITLELYNCICISASFCYYYIIIVQLYLYVSEPFLLLLHYNYVAAGVHRCRSSKTW